MIQFPGSRGTTAHHISKRSKEGRVEKYLKDMIIGLLRLIGIVGIGGGLVYLGLGVYGYIVSVDDIRPIIE